MMRFNPTKGKMENWADDPWDISKEMALQYGRALEICKQKFLTLSDHFFLSTKEEVYGLFKGMNVVFDPNQQEMVVLKRRIVADVD